MNNTRLVNILLVVPFRADITPYVPLGLGYIATALEKKGYSVKILDCIKERMDFDNFEAYLKNTAPPDFIGFTVFTAALISAKKHLKIVKKLYPNIITVIGGPHPSGSPKMALHYLNETDFGFIGEAEIGFPLLVERIANKRYTFYDIPGLIYRKDGDIVANPPLNHLEINDFGFPDWELIKPNEYPEDSVAILTTRGCPYSCTFCAAKAIHGKKLRVRSLNSIIQEIKLLQTKYGIKRINIGDDNFTLNDSLVRGFCEKVIEQNIKAEFVCSNGIRLDRINESMLKSMKKAGFSWVGVGIESGSENILKKMKKDITIPKIKEGVELINRCGLKVWGFFIIGYPGETEQDIKKTIDLALSLDVFNVSISTFLPLPGSEIYEDLWKEGKIAEDYDYKDFVPWRAWHSDTIPKNRLDRLRAYAFLGFKLKFKLNFIFKKIFQNRIFFAGLSSFLYYLALLLKKFFPSS